METKREPRILGAREMGLLYRASQAERFYATAQEREIINKFAAEGLVEIFPGESNSKIEVTNLGARCWYETLKAQNRLRFTTKGEMLVAKR